MAYGTTSKAFFKVYATTKQRQQDINGTDKAAAESDTTVDSDSGDSNTEQAEWPKHHNPGMSRQDRKQLDREIPWRHILTMPPAYIDKFLAAIDKETNSWSEWRSVKPLSREEAQAVLRDKILSKRVLRSRACYRDKNVGQGEVKAKCRIVCLGHQDPDLEVLNRSSPTPGRTSEMVMYAMIVAGMNQELFDTQKPWLAWAGDAQTAFLQGKQKDSERPLPLYMRPPKDGLIEKTGHWRSDLYQILGNVYGLSNAPHLWSEEVTSRLTSKGYGRHGFDPQLFIKRDPKSGYPVSMLIVYVDDFLGLHRADYEIAEIQDLFRWGDLQSFKAGQGHQVQGQRTGIAHGAHGAARLFWLLGQAVIIHHPADGLPGRLPGSRLRRPSAGAHDARWRWLFHLRWRPSGPGCSHGDERMSDGGRPPLSPLFGHDLTVLRGERASDTSGKPQVGKPFQLLQEWGPY
eukprot:g13388.t1